MGEILNLQEVRDEARRKRWEEMCSEKAGARDEKDSNLAFTFVMMSAVSEGDHTRFRTVFKGDPEISGRIGDKNVISAFTVFCVHIPGLVYVHGRVSRVGCQKRDGFVDSLFLLFL